MNTTATEAVWPLEYAEVKLSPPAGYSLSGVLLEPRILITKDGRSFSASLVARVNRKGQTTFFPTVREGANYIADGTQIKPLPKDSNHFFLTVLKGKNPSALSFPEVIALMRASTEEMPVVIDPSVWESANNLAAKTSLENPVPGLNATLYAYQEHGIAWMSECLGVTGGLILADEMGLGKTLQIIGLLLLHPPSPENPALIICPTTLIANWVREIDKFAPGLTKTVHRGQNRARIYKNLLAHQILITTYDTVISDLSILRSVSWSFVIADEAQAIKNPESQRRTALIQLPRRHSIAMTGTPVENSLKDLWSLSDFTIPGILGTETEFEILYPDSERGAADLSGITAPFILKRKVADVAADLPERIDIDLPIELGETLSAEYEKIREEILEKYPKAGALVATGQLQLFCAHPWLRAANTQNEAWEDDVTIDREAFGPLLTPKMELTVDLLQEAFTSGKKVLVFSIFNRIGDLLMEAGTNLPTSFWGAINGSTEQTRRQEIVDEFTAYEGPGVLILNPKAAGSGLNITAATVVIHYTQVWNPAIEAQASARAHRRGQDLPVTIYRLYYEDTVERVMLERTLWKKSLAEDAVLITSDRNRADLTRALSISPCSTTRN